MGKTLKNEFSRNEVMIKEPSFIIETTNQATNQS
jgi:hypothetical protein